MIPPGRTLATGADLDKPTQRGSADGRAGAIVVYTMSAHTVLRRDWVGGEVSSQREATGR